MASIAQHALVERDAEIAEVHAAIEDARRGAGSALVIEGPAGIGKTRLLLEAAAMARAEGMTVLEARGSELERDFSFGAVHQLFDGLLARSPGEGQAMLLRGAATNARKLFRLDEPAADEPQPRNDTFAVTHALYWLCENLAEETSLALTIDDADQADEESLAWLRFLANRIADLPIVIVLTVLRNGPSAGAAELEWIRSATRTSVIRPRPITVDGSRTILGETFGDAPEDAFLLACHDATAGNPFLLRELALALATAGVHPVDESVGEVHDAQPQRVAQRAATSLARLPREAQALCRAAAIFGAEAPLRHAAAIARLGLSVAHSSADALVERGLIDTVSPLRFRHSIVRTAVYASIPDGTRATAHRRAAELLAVEGASVEQVGAHLVASSSAGDAWVVTQLRNAAQRALGNGSAKSAVVYLSRALQEPPPEQARPAVLRELGSAETRIGKGEAVTHLREALDGIVDAATHAAVARELALALTTFGKADHAVELLEEEIELVRTRDRESALLLEADLIGYAQFAAVSPGLPQKRLARWGQAKRASTPGERALMVHRAVARSLTGVPLSEVADIAEEALGDGRLLIEQTSDAPGFYTAVHILIDAERFELVDAALEQALDEARSRGSVLGFAIASTQRSSAAYLRGAIPDAEAEVVAALETAEEAGWEVGLPMTLSAHIDVLVEQARFNEAEAALSTAGLLGEIPELTAFDWLLYSRGRLRLAMGDVEGGLRDLLRQGERQTRTGTLPIRMNWRTLVAPALATTGNADRARELAEQELHFARQVGTSRNIGMALRTLGVVTKGESGIEYLRQATAVLETAPARLEYARTLALLGAALRRSNRRSNARDALRQAITVATRCGASALADTTTEELAALGVRTPTTSSHARRWTLTPSELRVARMASRGMSNPEIAQALFVTRKTIEKHLGNAYTKLGIASRQELGIALQAAADQTAT